MRGLILVLMIFAVGPAEARRRCLISETSLVSSGSVSGSCYVAQEPVLVEGLFTFPYLGTRSYRVKYWVGRLVQPSSYVSTYVTQVTNRCSGEVVSSGTFTEFYDTTTSSSLENANTDERIDDVNLLEPMSRSEMEAKWDTLKRACGL